MEIRKKDNLTDLVENLPKTPEQQTGPKPEAGQVVDSEGEIINLGGKNRQTSPFSTNKNSYEPALNGIIKNSIGATIDKILDKYKKNKGK